MDGVIYGVDYAENPQIKSAIQQFKYRFTESLAEVFGGLMAKKLSELNMNEGKINVLIPVPLHKKRLNYRGFNQAELLAESTANISKKTIVLNALYRTRHTDQQAKLSKRERQTNLKNAFIVNKKFVQADNKKSVFFVVDDVCTTGSTLENCAKTLKEAGVEKVYGLVVARAFK
ncbi:ComF family protein [Candidatus Peregrinibacteria bacterium]|nr:ComF family protein [Candidatus Peregrinibacteria bacterium]